MATELISLAELRSRLGLSTTTIHYARKAGRITIDPADRDPVTGRPRARWPDVLEQYQANTVHSKRRHVGSQGGMTRNDKPTPAIGIVPAAVAARADHGSDASPDPSTRDEPVEVDESGDPVVGTTMSMSEAQRVKVIITARHALLELQRDRGELVRADDVKARAFREARMARDAILTIPDRLAPILASQTDLLEVHRTLLEECERICREIAARMDAA